MHKPSLHPLLLPLVKVCGAEILVRLLPRQHHVDDGEDGMPDRNQGTFLPPACGNPFVLGCERGVFGFGGDMGNFDEDLAQPAIPLARLPAQALAPTLVVPRTHPGPRGKMLGAGKTAHIGADLGNEDLGRALTDSRNRIQQDDGLLVHRQTLVNFPTDALKGSVSKKLWWAVTRPSKASFSWSRLARRRPRAKSARISTSRWPARIASSIARAETPLISVTTDASFRFASSKTACNRLRVRARSWTSVLR